MFFTFLKAVVLFSLTSVSGIEHNVITDRVDLIELNHYFDSAGCYQFDQVIYYEWSPEYRRFFVVSWNLVEGDLCRFPIKMPCGKYVVLWYDRDSKMNRRIIGSRYRETWSQVDPERENKKFMDEEDRRGLIKHLKDDACGVDCK